MSSIGTGTRLGHYEVVAPLGAGGMGEVYRAKDTKLGREVAIKVLPRHLQQDEDALARFEREAKVISGLNHPHILTIHEVGKMRIRGDWRATHYMVTELIEGCTLRELMSKEAEGRKLVEYMAQVADALQKAHSAGVIHRDLKPENIMVSADGYAKVLDFGLAKIVGSLVGAETSDGKATEKFQTQRGIVIGTLGYMSPEQVQGRRLDHRSDIFSFGCILYEVLSGRRPFEADGVVDTLHHILHSPAPSLSSQITQDLRRIVEKCLSKEIEGRFDSMRTIAAAIREAVREYDGTVRPPSKKTKAVSSRSSSRIKSLAVLPFVNATSDPEMEYLSDGITESVIHAMSRIGKRLRVMARTTVFSYKGKSPTPQQLAQELGVTSVVSGRVQRMGANLLINIELVNTRDGSQLWGDRFRTQFSDIFEVQDEIANHIAEELKLQVSTTEKRRLMKRATKKSEAYELYLKGRYHANKRTTDGVQRGIDEFEKALGIDPDYALARAGLADCYAILSARFLGDPLTAWARAETEARKAVELDPTLAEPRATLGHVNLCYKWNWTEAERDYRRAISLDANYAPAHHWYSVFLNCMDRRDEAFVQARAALDLDPLSLLYNCHYADLLYFDGQYQQALEHIEKALDGERYFLGYLLKGRTYTEMGRFDEGLEAIEEAISLEGAYPELVAARGYVQASRGDVKNALRSLDELKDLATRQFVAPSFFAEVCLALGNIEDALRYAEEFFELRAECADILVGPRFARLREDDRWLEMLERVGFPSRATSSSPAFAPTANL